MVDQQRNRMNKLPSYIVTFPLWDIVDKWSMNGRLGEELHTRAIDWLSANGLPAIEDIAREVGTDVEFDKQTEEFRVIVHTPWR